MIAVCVLGLALGAGGVAAESGLVEWHELAVEGVCTLRVAVPQGWRAELEAPNTRAVSIRLSPETGPRAEVLITGLAPKGEGDLKSSGDIKRAAREIGEQLLPDSVEKRLELERVDGTAGSGFFYSLTDKRSTLPEGQFRRMAQGIMAVGPLRLAVTALSDDQLPAVKAVAFDLLRTAECRPAPARPK